MNTDRVGLGELCEFIRGVTFDANEVRSSKVDGYVPILRAGNIGDTLNVDDDLVWVPADRVSPEQFLQIGDIAICMSSGSADVLGKTAQLKAPFSGSVGAFCGIVRPRDLAQANYIAHWLQSPAFLAWRDGQARGVNIQNLRFSEFAELQIPLPPLPEQQRIAAILDKADRLRRLRRYALDLGETYLQSVFLEMFSDPIGNPRHWPVRKLNDVCLKIQDGTHFSPPEVPKGVPYITSKNIRRDRIDIDNLTFVSEEDHRVIYRRCDPKPGDVLYVKDGVNAGIAKVNDLEYEFTMLSSVALLRTDRRVLSPYFLESYLNFPSVYDRFYSQVHGGAIKRLTLEMIKELSTVVPPLALQEKFAGIVRQYDRLRAQQRESLRQAEMLFGALLEQAFAVE